MAKQTLPTNFKDDILAPSMGGKRRYILTDNGDGTYSLDDATDYTQAGSDFGAGQINSTNQAVNESCDKADVIDNLDDIAANQANGMIAGAKAVAELNGNFNNFKESRYKKLWTGTWTSGSITVPGLNDYNVFEVAIDGSATVIIGFINESRTNFRAFGLYALSDANQRSYTLDARVSGEKLTMVRFTSLGHQSSGAHNAISDIGVSRITGIA